MQTPRGHCTPNQPAHLAAQTSSCKQRFNSAAPLRLSSPRRSSLRTSCSRHRNVAAHRRSRCPTTKRTSKHRRKDTVKLLLLLTLFCACVHHIHDKDPPTTRPSTSREVHSTKNGRAWLPPPAHSLWTPIVGSARTTLSSTRRHSINLPHLAERHILRRQFELLQSRGRVSRS